MYQRLGAERIWSQSMSEKEETETQERVELAEVQFIDEVRVFDRPGSLWNDSIHVNTRALLDWNGAEKVLMVDKTGKLHSVHPIHTVVSYKPKQ